MMEHVSATRIGIAPYKQASDVPPVCQLLLLKDVKINEAGENPPGYARQYLNNLCNITTSQLLTASAGCLLSLENALQSVATKTTNVTLPNFLSGTKKADLTTITQGQAHLRHAVLSVLEGQAQKDIYQPALAYQTVFFPNEDGMLQMDQKWFSVHKATGHSSANVSDNAKFGLVPFCNGPHFDICLWADDTCLARLSDGTLKATNWSITTSYKDAKGIYNHDSATAAGLYEGLAYYQAQLSLLDYPAEIHNPSYGGKLRLVVQMTIDNHNWFALVLSGASIARTEQASHRTTQLLETKIQLSAAYPSAALAVYFGVNKDDRL